MSDVYGCSTHVEQEIGCPYPALATPQPTALFKATAFRVKGLRIQTLSILVGQRGRRVILSFEQHAIPFDTVADSSVRLKNPYHGLLCGPKFIVFALPFENPLWQPHEDDWLPLMSPKGRTANQDHLPFFLPKCVTQMIGNVVLSDTPLVVRCHFGRLGHGYLLLFCSLKSKLSCCQVSHPRIDCNMTWSTAFV